MDELLRVHTELKIPRIASYFLASLTSIYLFRTSVRSSANSTPLSSALARKYSQTLLSIEIGSKTAASRGRDAGHASPSKSQSPQAYPRPAATRRSYSHRPILNHLHAQSTCPTSSHRNSPYVLNHEGRGLATATIPIPFTPPTPAQLQQTKPLRRPRPPPPPNPDAILPPCPQPHPPPPAAAKLPPPPPPFPAPNPPYTKRTYRIFPLSPPNPTPIAPFPTIPPQIPAPIRT